MDELEALAARLEHGCAEAGAEAVAAAMDYVNAARAAVAEGRRQGVLCCTFEAKTPEQCDVEVTSLEAAIAHVRDAVAVALDQVCICDDC